MGLERRRWPLWAAVGLMLLALLLVQRGRGVVRQELSRPLSSLPLSLGTWRALGPDQTLDRRTLEILRPQSYLLRNYMDPYGRLCALFVAYFGLQTEGQMIHSPRHCLPGAGWQIISRRRVAVPAGKGRHYTVNHLVLANELDRLSVLYWYQGRGKVEADEYRDRLSLMIDGILHDRSDGALVRLTMVLNPRDSELLKRQIELAAALIPALDALMPPLGSGR